ncbi:hypothetical protein Ancab_022691 [Ancistrocladus abbreviatus]
MHKLRTILQQCTKCSDPAMLSGYSYKCPSYYRHEAAAAISHKALTRLQDPVYGFVGYVYALQQQVNVQLKLSLRKPIYPCKNSTLIPEQKLTNLQAANLQEESEILGNCFAVRFASCGGPQAANSLNDGLQQTEHVAPANKQEYIDDQQKSLRYAPNTGSNMINNRMKALPQSLCDWEGQALSQCL